ncbi:Ig-like domain-containing protein [Aquimarina sp. W85]|uniref:Ig-like domain-containing protein n=1 Tax=Aquimarina rhodophyticola TaxID=3342246 RepID=UPI0036731B58
MKNGFLLLTFSVALICLGCAKKGTITGGEKDTTAPEFIRATPPNFSTNFDKKEIRIYFDEYIKLKDPQQQIVISPPMDPKPTITPLGGANKYVKIKFLDTLLQNTTYSISFGESIVDNNESNPLPFFKYVFSTGDFLDSLKIKGSITDAIARQPDPFTTIALYPMDENYTDSIIYKQVPRYVSSTLDSTGFVMENLKAGKYRLIALKDAATNYTYQPKQDKIGFYHDTIEIPRDTAKVISLTLFKEVPQFKFLKPKQSSKNSLIFAYEGEVDSTRLDIISTTPENFKHVTIRDRKTDTLHYWFRPYFEADSLQFIAKASNSYQDTLTTRFKDQYKDSLTITPITTAVISPLKNFQLSANIPLASVNDSLIVFLKDSINVPFTTQIDSLYNTVDFEFEQQENQAYTLKVLPNAIKDFMGNVNDSLSFSFSTKKITDYGKIFMDLENVTSFPLIIQLIDDKDNLISEKYIEKLRTITFEYLKPGAYDIRVILDTNANKRWDTGNFLKGIQPEKIIYFPTTIDVRANWELRQKFVLD